MPSTLTITKLSDLTISISNDGVITISYPGQTSITNNASTYYDWYTYGVLGSGANPLTFVSKASGAPGGGLKTESYVNNAHLSIGLGTNAGAKYAIIGNGDMRPTDALTAISINIDNEGCNSGSASYPNNTIVYTSGSGAGATVSFYHP